MNELIQLRAESQGQFPACSFLRKCWVGNRAEFQFFRHRNFHHDADLLKIQILKVLEGDKTAYLI